MTIRHLAAYAYRLWRLVAEPAHTWNARVRLSFHGAHLGRNLRVRGPLNIRVDPTASITIGTDCRINSGFSDNAVGGSLRTGIWVGPAATLRLGNRVALSNATFVCMSSITIGDDVFIGGDCRIYDTDFHSIDPKARLTPPDKTARTAPISVGARAFIGAHTTILKGSVIGEEAVIGAGSLVAGKVPGGEIWAGSPAHFIRRVAEHGQ